MEPSINESQQREAELLASIPLPALAFCLLWWVFLNPAAYTRAKALPDMANRQHRAMNLLVSTLLIAIPAIPLIGLTAQVVPLSHYGAEAGYIPQHWLIVVAGIWLLIVWLSYSASAKPVLSIALDGLLSLIPSVVMILIILAIMALPPSAGGNLIVALLAGLSASFFHAFEVPVCWLNSMVSSRWLKLLFAAPFVLMLGVIIFFLSFIVKVVNGWGISLAFLAAWGIDEAIKKQESNRITKLLFIALPITYAALVWIYWFGGWQVLGAQ